MSSPSLATSSSLPAPILRLALPVLAEESLTLLVGYTDWWLVGHYLPSPAHKAAMGLMGYVAWLLPSLFAAVAIGATAIIARAVGAGDIEHARKTANQAIMLGAFFALLATCTAMLLGVPFIGWMQLRGEAAALAARYLWILVPAIPFIMVEQVAAACLRGAGDTISGFVAKTIVNVINVSVSALLVLGPGPIPRLGWEGIAIGTACGHMIGGTLLLGLLVAGRAKLRLRCGEMWPDPLRMRPVLRVGLPGGLDVLAVLFCHLMYVSIINGLGTMQAAAHGLGVQIEALAYLPGAAFQVAAATVTGQLLGAGKPRLAVRGAWLTLAMGSCVMWCSAAAFYLVPVPLTTFFTGNADDPTGRMTAELLTILAVSTPPLAFLQILTGALRGAGDTRVPLVITFVGLLCIRLPLAGWMSWDEIHIAGLSLSVPGLGLGVAGAWWAMTVDVILRSLLVTVRFWRGKWQAIRV